MKENELINDSTDNLSDEEFIKNREIHSRNTERNKKEQPGSIKTSYWFFLAFVFVASYFLFTKFLFSPLP